MSPTSRDHISDPFKCSALLNKGHWLDPSPRWASPTSFKNWQPPGCMLREYKRKDIQACFQSKRLVFVGDSTTRQVFWAVAQKLDREKADAGIADMLRVRDHRHMDLEFYAEGVMLQFVWDAWLNGTRLGEELKDFTAVGRKESVEDAKKGLKQSAGLILLGAPGLWYARHGEENYHKDFRDAIDAVIPYMDHSLNPSSPRSAFASREYSPNLLLLAPVQVPWYQDLSPSREETITPEKVDQMNDYLQQVSANSKADILWSYSLMTWNQPGAYEESGLHVVSNVAHRKADVLLNSRCNSDASMKHYPFDGTCCNNYVQAGFAQDVIIFVGMILLPALFLLRRKQPRRFSRLLPSIEVTGALSVFTLVLCYCFYADRTQIFEKAHRQFRSQEFVYGVAAVAVLSLLSIRKNDQTNIAIKEGSSTDPGSLAREQTEEWKGWMQAIILIYHYTHGSQHLWIYMIVRLLIASYLFMTGFGHTNYFLRKDDYSLGRVASVLLRLNLLSCLLPYTMRTDYVFYYFAPLVSFWFVIIYITLRIGRGLNSNIYFLIAKILLSMGLTTAFTMIPGILESLAFVLLKSCNISWDVTEWRFRVFLDMYIVYVGMIMAILFDYTRKLRAGRTPATYLEIIIQFTNRYQGLWRTGLTIVAAILLPLFWKINSVHTKKEDYNFWNPYLSFISVLSFMVLRNSHRLLRTYHSTLFAWLGRCSLETYVLQYHIWLAGDAKGLLGLGLFDPKIEMVVLTVLFLWVSWGVSGATQMLTSWIVDGGTEARGSRNGPGSPVELRLPYRRENDEEREEGKAKGTWRAQKGDGYQSLPLRLGVIGLGLWIANVTYR
ncbi:hypothetical protein GLAREA_04421 [Glarea lozoyensis ATCC 20868]|uniref:Cas1p 10 TM acyl transferase domain-containing protein n=1 Tax=Glarea lozoyensis (strain ATCC 20868 / MF5171) TaxID=1116229 RepID=S3CPK9_GLAL2|nr:uncharacterized protein GLAREA_04421 [Glarea lozoyensis ATCC 20868]EPE27630.1 hypothetical protein GLAREA_04421 [Glarea lozoyensis ATCC 20868]